MGTNDKTRATRARAGKPAGAPAAKGSSVDEIPHLVTRFAVLTALHAAGPLDERIRDALAAIVPSEELGLAGIGGVFRMQPETQGLELVAALGDFEQVFRDAEIEQPNGSCLCCRTVADGQTRMTGRCPAAGDDAPDHCIVPLKGTTRIEGVMFLFQDPQRPPDETSLATIDWIGEALGIAIEREETSELQTVHRLLVTLRHEINNPVQGILGTTEALLRGDFDKATRDEHLGGIAESANRIATFLRTSEVLTGVKRIEYCPGTDMLQLHPGNED